jgi:hypothetical protein
MVRLREIDDLELREQLRQMIAESRDMMPGSIPDWWEMDDADLSLMLIELRYKSEHRPSDEERFDVE